MTIEQAVTIRSSIPARLDRLGWSPFHTRMVAGLGAAWILDGLQITISRTSPSRSRRQIDLPRSFDG
jgi:hypothetical protein